MGRIALAAFSLLVVLLCLELGVRLFGGVEPAAHALCSFHQSDPQLGWIGRPNLHKRFASREFDVIVEHDAAGFRKPEPAPPAAPQQRLLVLGDSFTWGSGVGQGQLFTDHLQVMLGSDIAVTNRGVNGIGTAQEYLLLQRELAVQHFEFVLLQFTPNDVEDNDDDKAGRRPWFTLEAGQLVAQNPHPRPLMGRGKRTLKEHSRLFNLVAFRWNLLDRKLRTQRNLRARAKERPGEDLRLLPGFDVTVALLQAMDTLVREHGGRFALLYAHPGDPLAYASAAELAERAGVAWLDLVPALRDQPELTLTFEYNRHWTADGHRAVAEALYASPMVADLLEPEPPAVSAPPAAGREASPTPAPR